jgi:hypothetical protein
MDQKLDGGFENGKPSFSLFYPKFSTEDQETQFFLLLAS